MGKMDFKLLHSIKGFMADEEALRLHELALAAASMGPILEIGSYCGRSAATIGWACKKKDGVLFSIDHHTGSEEQQPGEAYFDPDLYDTKTKKTPLSMVFIDGGHSFDTVYQDFLTWSPHIMAKGFLVIHDIFFDPAQGGPAPGQVYEIAVQTGDYTELPMTHTLGVLQQNIIG